MCRNIKTLYHYSPPVTEDEIRAAALQYLRKISGFNQPSRANLDAFEAAVDAITSASVALLNSLETHAPPRNRAKEITDAQARSAKRFLSQK